MVGRYVRTLSSYSWNLFHRPWWNDDFSSCTICMFCILWKDGAKLKVPSMLQCHAWIFVPNVCIQGIVKMITRWSKNHNRYVRCWLGFALSSKLAKFSSSNIELSPCSSLCVRYDKKSIFDKVMWPCDMYVWSVNKLCGRSSNALFLFLICKKICENPKIKLQSWSLFHKTWTKGHPLGNRADLP